MSSDAVGAGREAQRTEWPNVAVRVVSVAGVGALVAAAYRMTGGLQAFLLAAPFVVWGLAPFAVALWSVRRPPVTLLRAIGLIATSGFGLCLYLQLCLATRLSSTVGLMFLFIPLWQLVGCALVILLTRRWTRSRPTRG